MRMFQRLFILPAIVLLLLAMVSGCSGSDFMFPAVTQDWVKIWGDNGYDEGIALTLDAAGNLYVTGNFENETDFDPSEGEDIHTSSENGGGDTFLSKFDSAGDFKWARTWGGEGDWLGDSGYDVAVGDEGGIYVIGNFSSLVDFDPGPDAYEISSAGQTDIFLAKFDDGGNFQWVYTWGTGGFDNGLGVDIDQSGDIYVAGSFEGTIDLDPSDDVDEHASNGIADIFILKLAADGGYMWGRSFGGEWADYPEEIDVDDSGNVFITGNFSSPTIDLDPGAGTDTHTSFAKSDVFLVKLNADGEYRWGRTWGGYGNEGPADIAVSGDGKVYVIGSFKDPIDFNIGGEMDIHYSSGIQSAYMTCRDSDGNYIRTLSWGGDDFVEARALAVDALGNVYACCSARGTLDLDPGDDEYRLSTNLDVVISKFNPAGEFLWAGQWIGNRNEAAFDIALDSVNNIYATGIVQNIDQPVWASPKNPEWSPPVPDAFLLKFPEK